MFTAWFEKRYIKIKRVKISYVIETKGYIGEQLKGFY